jgi:hypothetical protein
MALPPPRLPEVPAMAVEPPVPVPAPLVVPPAPALLVAPALPELSSPSLLHAARAVAETSVAPNANVAARPRRVRGSCGSGVPARSSGNAQNGHSVSETRT